jgi:anthranilate/para-aminobenzoate synthase component I
MGGAADDRAWPLFELGHCPDALIYDHVERRWFAVGDPPLEPLYGASSRVPRSGPRHLLPPPNRFTSSLSRAEYLAAARRALDCVAAGDAFQVNLARRLTTTWSGSLRELAQRGLARSAARYGASLELPRGRALLSLSPELFLDFDPESGRIVTRPIKGTRPATAPPRELRESVKDAAELHMIVDLMRNDLGRVAEFGSVRVASGRSMERHRTVQHGVAEIVATARPGTTPVDLLRATFPPGSVTGAPKIRAMQIIDELEPVRRGPYCGAVGYISDCGRMSLSVAIRTLTLCGARTSGSDAFDGTLDYGTGGGIVADSDPTAEYAETETKAAVLTGI